MKKSEARILTEQRGARWRWYILSNYKQTRERTSAVLAHGSAATEAEAEARALAHYNTITK